MRTEESTKKEFLDSLTAENCLELYKEGYCFYLSNGHVTGMASKED